MRQQRNILRGILLLAIVAEATWGQQPDYGSRLGVGQGTATNFRPQGPQGMLDAIDPAVRRWYVPQELFAEYRWRQWEYTNYARSPYQRYINADIEGSYFYDLYGNFINQGWLVYNTSQERPQEFGNVVFQSSRFDRWFSGVVVAADQKGSYFYALTVSRDLRTTLTPMTFSKARLDGVQADLASDKYEGTLIYSRISGPRGVRGREVRRTSATTLFGGRFTAQVGDFTEMGIHMVNAHQANALTDRDFFKNMITGALTERQNFQGTSQAVTAAGLFGGAQGGTVGSNAITGIQIVLRDDSPEDGVGGAAFFPTGSDLLITYRDGSVDRGRDIGLEPLVEGGLTERGFISANGSEEIRLFYDFGKSDFTNRASGEVGEIVGVEFRLVVANDYQIWMTSNNQLDVSGNPVLLLVDQARGNIRDLTNLRTVSFEYGLPTATHILGGTLAVNEVLGFDLYGEYDLSWSYRKYPNVLENKHRASSGIKGRPNAPAWMVNASKRAEPFFFYGEAYSMDPFYNTQAFVAADDGQIDYSADRDRVELVEDNDDQDRVPDAFRSDWVQPDLQVFPGWDQNNDFVPDLNQNDNRVKINNTPDYEEPFMRFGVDRPEFLFGVDMNNNFWVDQYENDEEPDYPYRRDHRGYNAYGGVYLTPQLRLMAGVLREGLISSDQKNHGAYAVLNYDGLSPRYGRLRIFEMAKRVEDDIPNPLLQWAPDNTIRGGALTPLDDPLLGRDTWVNQFFVGHSLRTASLLLLSKLNYVYFHQRLDEAQRQRLGLDETDFFFGFINKARYEYELGRLIVEPRWKSEFRKQSRTLFEAGQHTSLMELFGALARMQLLEVTQVQAGMEYVWFDDFDDDFNDFNSLTVGLQFANTSAYQGYSIRLLTGIVLERKDFKERQAINTTQAFITIYAGLE